MLPESPGAGVVGLRGLQEPAAGPAPERECLGALEPA
jgi:hypothetical protein